MNWRLAAVRVLAGGALVALLAWFAYANSGQSVDLDLGLFTLRGVSVPVLVYGAVVVGMLLMVAVSLRADLQTRRTLDRYDQIAADVLRDIDDAGEEKEKVLKQAGDEK